MVNGGSACASYASRCPCSRRGASSAEFGKVKFFALVLVSERAGKAVQVGGAKSAYSGALCAKICKYLCGPSRGASHFEGAAAAADSGEPMQPKILLLAARAT